MLDNTEFEEAELAKVRSTIAAGEEAAVELKYVEAAFDKARTVALAELLLPSTDDRGRDRLIATVQAIDVIRALVTKTVHAGIAAEFTLEHIAQQEQEDE